jgi:hypothetical protein
MKEVTIKDCYHHNLRENGSRSTFVIGKVQLSEGEEILIRSAASRKAVRVKVLKSDTRDMPIFSEDEAQAIAGKDPLYMTYVICRENRIEDLDRGITYIAHSYPQPVP